MIDYNAQTVDSTKWTDMTYNELIEQRNRMYDRYDFLLSQKKNVKTIIEGIMRLDDIITKRSAD